MRPQKTRDTVHHAVAVVIVVCVNYSLVTAEYAYSGNDCIKWVRILLGTQQ